MHIPSLIEHKREGGRLTGEQIKYLVAGFTDGSIPDYQMSAFAMAVYFKGMDAEETSDLTQAMLDSGSVFSYPDHAPAIVDKHSTGGIGDKVSLVLAPLLACGDVWVPMVSGRGLGITGGTLDKLESIPGFSVDLYFTQALAQLESVGTVIMGQTEDLCPADKKLYALRDVTGTVPSIPMIVASIMSKKLAESLDRLVLDVKYGSGAFMTTQKEAMALAEAMTNVGESMGVEVSTVLSPMSEPLGEAVGNALEVQEAIDTLKGNGPNDLTELVLDLAAKVSDVGRDQLEIWLRDGSAWNKWVAMVKAQGGDTSVLDHFDKVHPAPVVESVVSPKIGTVHSVDAGAIGRASLLLGAGRQAAGDRVDFSVGFSNLVKTGRLCAKGERLATIHAKTPEDAAIARESVLAAINIGK